MSRDKIHHQLKFLLFFRHFSPYLGYFWYGCAISSLSNLKIVNFYFGIDTLGYIVLKLYNTILFIFVNEKAIFSLFLPFYHEIKMQSHDFLSINSNFRKIFEDTQNCIILLNFLVISLLCNYPILFSLAIHCCNSWTFI